MNPTKFFTKLAAFAAGVSLISALTVIVAQLLSLIASVIEFAGTAAMGFSAGAAVGFVLLTVTCFITGFIGQCYKKAATDNNPTAFRPAGLLPPAKVNIVTPLSNAVLITPPPVTLTTPSAPKSASEQLAIRLSQVQDKSPKTAVLDSKWIVPLLTADIVLQMQALYNWLNQNQFVESAEFSNTVLRDKIKAISGETGLRKFHKLELALHLGSLI